MPCHTGIFARSLNVIFNWRTPTLGNRAAQPRGVTDEAEILEFLKNGTLVGLLPVPHAILIRKYQTNPGTSVWFSAYIWGVIYLKSVELDVWHHTNVKLFRVRVVETM